MISLGISHFLIVCPLVFLGGFVDAVAGGGGLISLPAYLIAGLPPVTAIGTNKLSSAMGTALTTARFAKDGYIPKKQILFYIVCALIGSAAGAKLALLLDGGVFKLLLLVILPVTAFFVSKSRSIIREREPFPPAKTALIASAVALVIGAYDGFYGPGTGTFLILLLTAAAHMSIFAANGTAKVINLTTNLSALAVYITSGSAVYVLGLAAGLFGIAGNYLGARYFEKGGARSVQPIMICVLTLFFFKLLYELALQ